MSLDNPDVYVNMLRDVKQTNGTVFYNEIDKEIFFNDLKLASTQIYSEHGFEILCHKFGVNGYEKLTVREISKKYKFSSPAKVETVVRRLSV